MNGRSVRFNKFPITEFLFHPSIRVFAINITAVLLSLFGYLTPVTGALVHNGTSILVVASSALLLYRKKKKQQNKDSADMQDATDKT